MPEQEATTPRRASGAPDTGNGLLSGLLAPLRLSERVLDGLGDVFDALGVLAASVRDLPAIHAELVRIRESTEPLAGLVTTLEHINEGLGTRIDALHDDLAPLDERLVTLERTTRSIAENVAGIREDILGVKDDIQRITGLRGERSALERMRDKITGGDQPPARGRPEAPGT